ncbi:MAG: hypothetical protein JWM21_4185 [Acidobacteria bacterium]|nr:hypothetical protein [Acidobacteriota bacterium]
MRNEREQILIALAGHSSFGTTNALMTTGERKLTVSSGIAVLCPGHLGSFRPFRPHVLSFSAH